MAVKKLNRQEIELFLTAIKSNADMLKSLLDTKVILANNVQTTLASLITYGSKIGINAAELILTQNAIKPDVDKLKSDINALQGTGGTFLGLGSQDADADDIELAFAGDNPKNGDRIMKQVDMGGGKTGWQVWKYDDAKTPKWNPAGQIVEAALIDLSAFMKLDGSNYQGTPLANIVSNAITSGINTRLNDLQGLANKTVFTETKTFATGQMVSSLFYDGANSYLPNQPKATDGWKLKNLVASFEQIANDVPFDYVMSNIVTADGRVGFHIEDRSNQNSNNKLHVYFDMDNVPTTAGRMHDVTKSGWFASNQDWKLSFVGTWEKEIAIVVPSDKGKFDDGSGNIAFVSQADGTTPEKTIASKASVDKNAADIAANAKKVDEFKKIGQFKGTYSTTAARDIAVPNPVKGDFVLIGTATPYDEYVYDTSWKKTGSSDHPVQPLDAAEESIKVVTSEGHWEAVQEDVYTNHSWLRINIASSTRVRITGANGFTLSGTITGQESFADVITAYVSTYASQDLYAYVELVSFTTNFTPLIVYRDHNVNREQSVPIVNVDVWVEPTYETKKALVKHTGGQI